MGFRMLGCLPCIRKTGGLARASEQVAGRTFAGPTREVITPSRVEQNEHESEGNDNGRTI